MPASIARDSWKRLPQGGVVNLTPFVILVRPGNPLEHPGLRGPGAARRAHRASGPDDLGRRQLGDRRRVRRGRARDAGRTRPRARRCSSGIWKNVVAQAASARAARTQFENGFGDALITYEQEALYDRGARAAPGRRRLSARGPSCRSTPSSCIDRNVRPRERALVDAFVQFLWSEEAQRIFVKYGFRSANEALERGQPGVRRDRRPLPDRGLRRLASAPDGDRGRHLEGARHEAGGRAMSAASRWPSDAAAGRAALPVGILLLVLLPLLLMPLAAVFVFAFRGGAAAFLKALILARGAVRAALQPADRVRDGRDQRRARHVHGVRPLALPLPRRAARSASSSTCRSRSRRSSSARRCSCSGDRSACSGRCSSRSASSRCSRRRACCSRTSS